MIDVLISIFVTSVITLLIKIFFPDSTLNAMSFFGLLFLLVLSYLSVSTIHSIILFHR